MSARIIVADVLAGLATLADESVQCVVTSPPYLGLRDYGVAGQIGLERTPAEYVEKMVAVFREVRRVLRADGTLWLNLGDSYNAYNGGAGRGSKLSGNQTKARPRLSAGHGLQCKSMKPKDLIGIPWRVAFALQSDGWWLRSDIIWSKPNPMPESVTDRPTKAHEYLFLLTKSARYFYDAEAISEPVAGATVERLAQPGLADQEGSPVPFKTNGNMKATPPRFGGQKYGDSEDEQHRTKSGNEYEIGNGRRNARTVWTIATTPYSGAHFATFPPELPRRCILAGSRAGDTVLDPFAGAMTTGLVANRLGRDFVGIELNAEYAAMAARRMTDDSPLFSGVEMTTGDTC
jgi:DNA modification methylase